MTFKLNTLVLWNDVFNKMKYSLIVTLMVVSLGTKMARAQDHYIRYYNLVNQANQHWYEKEYPLALEKYLAGFEEVPYVHTINLVKAARAAAKLKRYDLVQQFLAKAIKSGYPTAILQSKAYKKFRKTDQFESLARNLKHYRAHYENSVNKDYQRKIDSLHFIDQCLLRGNNKVAPFEITTEGAFSDSLNFACLLGLMEKYGFPSEQNIGYQGYRKSWVIIHHSARLPQNHHYHQLLLEALKNGAYQPENYCWVIDQGQTLLEQQPIFYHWDVATNIDLLTSEAKLKINALRAEVGMPPIERIEVLKTKSGTKHKVKW